MKTHKHILFIFVFILFVNRTFAESSNSMIQSAMDSVYQLSPANWVVTDQYTDKTTNLTHAYLQQRHQGIVVFNAINILVFKNNNLVYHKSGFIDNLKSKIKVEKPAINPMDGINYALSHLGIEKDPLIKEVESTSNDNIYIYNGGKLSGRNIKVELMYTPVQGEVFLTWNVSIDLKNQEHWWNVRVDATTGKFISKNDYVAHCSFDAMPAEEDNNGVNPPQNSSSSSLPPPGNAYLVFPLPIEAPNFGSSSLLINPADPIASPFGWHDVNGIAGEEFTITRGNNVHAYEDADNDDAPGYSPSGGPGLSFTAPYNAALPPLSNQDAALTNLFYVNNAIHDKLNPLGFSAVEGNFQKNNYGFGGEENDYLLAEGFDGSGINNANFATPPDGASPRMQMYIWNQGSCSSFIINSPASLAGPMTIADAQFNPINVSATGQLVLVNDGSALFSQGCSPIINNITGKIAVIDRGTCLFVQKVLNAQNAGAIGVIIVNNQDGVFQMGGFDPAIIIPSVMISVFDGAILKYEMLSSPVSATINSCVVQYDSNFDNGIIIHEYGHGVSNRLTGGPSNTGCLDNGEQAGEGWSDWLALMLTIEPGDQGANPRGIGNFVIGGSTTDPGIRFYPYSTDMSINPHTYADLSIYPEVHYTGEIWCSAVWDLAWILIDQYGYDPNPLNVAAGNNIALRLVLEGMKLQPCGPGFLDSRDAILQADFLLYNNAHRCKIWEAFARRGMGFYAQQGSADIAGDETADFSLPPGVETFVTGSGRFCRPQDALLDAGPGWTTYDWGNGINTRTFTPIAFGTYTVTVTGIGCSGSTESGTGRGVVTQSFEPSATATPSAVCSGGNSQLQAYYTEQIGEDIKTNGIYSSPAPYGNIWTSHHEQYLIRASELTAAGFSAGNLTSLAFDVVSHNSGPGSQNFNISLAHTLANNLSSTFINSGFQPVYSNPLLVSYTGWNVHTFSSPFNWDGTSNIVVDVTLMNCSTCPATPCVEYYLNDIVHLSQTAFKSCTYTFDDGNCSVPTFTPTSFVSVGYLRPNMRLSGNQTPLVYSYAWTPSTFLNNTVISNPVANNVTASTDYTVRITKPNGCYATASQRVEVTTVPAAPTAIYGLPAVCKGQSGVTYCVEPVPGATSYIWTLPVGATGSSNSDCITVNFSTKFQGGNICVKAVNPCLQGSNFCLYLSVQSSKPTRPNPITGASLVCAENYYYYYINPVPNADSYVWSITGNGGANPISIVYGQGLSFVYIFVPTGYNGKQSLSVKASNCKGLSAERKLDIKFLGKPGMPGSISGPATVCKSKTKMFNVSNASGASSYTWYISGGATILSGQGTNTVSVKFNSATTTSAYLMVYAGNDCGVSGLVVKKITVTLTCKTGNDSDEDIELSQVDILSLFTVYPNPTAGKITVQFTASTKVKLKINIVDLLGKLLLSNEIDAIEGINTKNIDLGDIAKGIYFLNIETEGRKTEALRLVVD